MIDRSIHIYLFNNHTDCELHFLNEIAKRCNLTYKNPRTSNFLVWTASHGGKISDLESLRTSISARTPIAFQMWWSEYEDLFCRIAFTETCVSYDCFLGGVSQLHLDRLLVAINDVIISPSFSNRVAALIVDTSGSSADVEWDDRLFDRLYHDDPLPDVLLMSTLLASYSTLNRRYYGIIPIADTIVRVVYGSDTPES